MTILKIGDITEILLSFLNHSEKRLILIVLCDREQLKKYQSFIIKDFCCNPYMLKFAINNGCNREVYVNALLK